MIDYDVSWYTLSGHAHTGGFCLASCGKRFGQMVFSTNFPPGPCPIVWRESSGLFWVGCLFLVLVVKAFNCIRFCNKPTVHLYNATRADQLTGEGQCRDPCDPCQEWVSFERFWKCLLPFWKESVCCPDRLSMQAWCGSSNGSGLGFDSSFQQHKLHGFKYQADWIFLWVRCSSTEFSPYFDFGGQWEICRIIWLENVQTP